VSKMPQLLLAIVSSLVVCASAATAENNPNSKPSPGLDQEFQSAVAHYHAGQLPEAAAQLEQLLPQVPKSFEVHELLGLVYAAQSQDAKAVEAAVNKVLNAGYRTADIARGQQPGQTPVSTQEMGKLVHQALAESIDRRQAMHAV